MSNALIEAGQDVKSAYDAGKWIAIVGTGYLLAKNWRVGLRVLARSSWAVATSGVRLGIQISTIWWQEVFRPAVQRMIRPAPPPPTPPGGPSTPARPIIDMKKTKSGKWRPPGGGGATAFFLFGGILVQSFVNMDAQLKEWIGDPFSTETNEFEDVR
tara:strand:- start:1581 stop:2051 length:471 start_codon:yes stop_codon:yes gene_type:complete